MKKLILMAGFIFCSSANSANIIFYDNDEKTDFLTIPSDKIIYVKFDEGDEELQVQVSSALGFRFSVSSKKEAMKIIEKLFDENTNEFIELKES